MPARDARPRWACGLETVRGRGWRGAGGGRGADKGEGGGEGGGRGGRQRARPGIAGYNCERAWHHVCANVRTREPYWAMPSLVRCRNTPGAPLQEHPKLLSRQSLPPAAPPIRHVAAAQCQAVPFLSLRKCLSHLPSPLPASLPTRAVPIHHSDAFCCLDLEPGEIEGWGRTRKTNVCDVAWPGSLRFYVHE